jgi:hypothetical protein
VGKEQRKGRCDDRSSTFRRRQWRCPDLSIELRRRRNSFESGPRDDSAYMSENSLTRRLAQPALCLPGLSWRPVRQQGEINGGRFSVRSCGLESSGGTIDGDFQLPTRSIKGVGIRRYSLKAFVS